MADSTNSSPLIQSKDQMIEALSKGCKPKADWRIGTEHEKFTFYTDTNMPVPYAGERGIEAILLGLKDKLNWTPLMDGEAIIGLKEPGKGGGAISLEPGGQFELSGAPLENLHQTCAEVHTHLCNLRDIATPLGISFLGTGSAPTWLHEDMPLMPKSRYGIMAPYMDKVGSLGKSMMFRSCTVQVNLDFSSEADMVKKMRVSLALQPIATAIFANSPFTEGKPNGFLSYRSEIWRHTDNNRAGMLPFVFDEGFGFEAYVDYALQVPMYFVIRDGDYINCAGESFADFLDGKLPQLPGEKPTIADWEDHISTIFPEVRLKQFLEMRGADGAPWQGICALPAFWTGLFYNENALEAAWDYVKDWTNEERQALRDQVPVTALHTKFRNTDVLAIAKDIVEISRQGLISRNYKNSDGVDESLFLVPVEDTLGFGKTLAERMLDSYHGAWNGDLDKLFETHAF